ncbi:hypothetical protein [Bartonella sp. B30(2025)]
MNKKNHIIKHAAHDKSSFSTVGKKGIVGESTEITMSDIAKKLHYVSAQLQMKHPLHSQASQRLAKDDLKSYLDDISRAILAEHYIRRQKEKTLFEHLEQIKTLIRDLHNEKVNLQKTTITNPVTRAKSSDSIVHHLAHMPCEKSQESASLQKRQNILRKNTVPAQTNVPNSSQQSKKKSLPTEVSQLVVKESKNFAAHSVVKGVHSDVQTSTYCIKNDQYTLPSQTKLLKSLFFSRYSVKKWCTRFLIIAFIATITLCFYGFREAHFFNFMML